ncbi:MAG: NifB/NifX family molybdenum-iron cluster-binding protein [Candidatus Hodarchaeota archaeon]
MVRRILIPSDDPDGKTVAGHFGRAPYFMVIDVGDDEQVEESRVVPNSGEHSGGRGHAHDNVLQFNPTVIISHGMGPRGLRSFESQRIAVLKAKSTSVEENIKAYMRGELAELTEGCADAHHR